MDEFLAEVFERASHGNVGLANVMSSASRYGIPASDARSLLRLAVQEQRLPEAALKEGLGRFLGLKSGKS